MAYIVVENMSAGVDRRRPIYASKQGSLWQGINGHLSRGGDFEKRKSFVSTYSLPSGVTFGLQTVGSTIVVFGGTITEPAGMPSGVNYLGLPHPGGVAISDVLCSELFDGKIYVIAEYSDGSILHWYDGELLTDWYAGQVKPWMTALSDIADHFVTLIPSKMAGYSASAAGAVLTITGPAGTDYSLTGATTNGGQTNDQAVTIANVQASSSGTETVATGSFEVTRSLNSYQYWHPNYNELVGFYIETTFVSVTVDGIELLPSSQYQISGGNSAAAVAGKIAAAINANVTSPNYTATASAGVVTISAEAGTGTGPNTFVVSPSSTNPGGTNGVQLTFDNINDMAGGAAGTTVDPEINTATFSGTVEEGDTFALTIDGTLVGYEAGNPAYIGDYAMTHKDKVYVTAKSLLQFSAVNNPTLWNADDDTGAGYINISNHDEGSTKLTGMAIYQGNIAVFTPNTVQLWYVEADNDNNILLQTLRRTGTRSPGSVQSFGDLDVFYLDNSGLRSIRAREQSNKVAVNDVGTLIDTLVQSWLADMTAAQITKIRSIIEPEDGRYWLAIDDKILVFSYFPGSKISGWTWYEPGFSAEWFADPGDDTGPLVRAGDTIYKYGGSDNATYDDDLVTCWLPFLDAGKPGHLKNWTGVDLMAVNTWDIDLLTDPTDLNRRMEGGQVAGYSLMGEGGGILGTCQMISPKITCEQEGAASISSIILYYDMASDDDK